MGIDQMLKMKTLYASSDTPTHRLGGAIAGKIRESGRCQLRAIGAPSVTKATNGLVHATEYMAAEGVAIVAAVSHLHEEINGRLTTITVWDIQKLTIS